MTACARRAAVSALSAGPAGAVADHKDCSGTLGIGLEYRLSPGDMRDSLRDAIRVSFVGRDVGCCLECAGARRACRTAAPAGRAPDGGAPARQDGALGLRVR